MGSSTTDAGRIGRTGARFGTAAPGPRFEPALRGYDRAAVDAYLAGQATVVDDLRAGLGEVERRLEAAETENAELRRSAPAGPAPVVETGFGSRAEKILRMAEREASEARAAAAAESAALIDAARSSAEAHRHDVEQELIGRVSRAEQTAAQLEAELVEREQQMARKLDADREEARRVHEAAVRAADVLRGAAAAEAEEIRLTARAEVESMRELARQELAQLRGMRHEVHTDLDRLVRLLETEARSGGARAAADRAGAAQSRPAEKVASVSALE